MSHSMIKTLISALLVSLSACTTAEEAKPSQEETKQQIHRVLDDWHQAAAEADFERYFGHFEGDSAIFMGTDATERWTVAAFRPWSKPYFDRGKAWSFTPEKRYIYFSKEGDTAWFDEALNTPNLGPSRGTGVLTRQAAGWKISHYNLTVPIPNAIVEDVVQQIDSTLNNPN